MNHTDDMPSCERTSSEPGQFEKFFSQFSHRTKENSLKLQDPHHLAWLCHHLCVALASSEHEHGGRGAAASATLCEPTFMHVITTLLQSGSRLAFMAPRALLLALTAASSSSLLVLTNSSSDAVSATATSQQTSQHLMKYDGGKGDERRIIFIPPKLIDCLLGAAVVGDNLLLSACASCLWVVLSGAGTTGLHHNAISSDIPAKHYFASALFTAQEAMVNYFLQSGGPATFRLLKILSQSDGMNQRIGHDLIARVRFSAMSSSIAATWLEHFHESLRQ